MYQFSPVQHTLEIRLVRFQTPHPDPQLKVAISHVRLDGHPSYRALSYTWGEAANSRAIECNDSKEGKGRLLIPANCELALRRLRQDDEQTPIWIDSVCIDQNNNTERNQQLLLMSDIYRLASKVQVYLGDEDETSALGMEYFKDPQKFSSLEGEQRAGSLHIGDIAFQARLAVNGILSRPWFERIWVLQEVLVSSSAEVLCGDRKVTWSELTSALIAFGSRNRVFLKEGVKEQSILFRFADSRKRGGMPEILLRYMHEARNFKSTDPRDKIYALLGLAADAAAGYLPLQPVQPSESQKIPMLRVNRQATWSDLGFFPDYNKSTTEVFIEFASSWIQRYKNLDVLCGAQVNSTLNSLPTWVPDWSIGSSRIALLSSLIMAPRLTLGDDHKYSASGELATDAVVLEDRRTLRVSGQPIGIIATLGDTYYNGESVFPGALLEQWNQLAAQLNPYTTGQTIDAALLQTIFASQLKYGANYNVSDELVRRWLQVMKLPINVTINQFLEPFQDPVDRYSDFREILDTIKRVCTGRRFAITTTGYMGLVPMETELGDMVSVLLGGQVPFILRERHDSYILVGEAYIHGVMRGELAGQRKSSSLAVQKFIIR